jgi:hypothetical protein
MSAARRPSPPSSEPARAKPRRLAQSLKSPPEGGAIRLDRTFRYRTWLRIGGLSGLRSDSRSERGPRRGENDGGDQSAGRDDDPARRTNLRSLEQEWKASGSSTSAGRSEEDSSHLPPPNGSAFSCQQQR